MGSEMCIRDSLATDPCRSLGTRCRSARRGIRKQQAAGARSIPLGWDDLRALGHRPDVRKKIPGEVGWHLSTRRVLPHDQPWRAIPGIVLQVDRSRHQRRLTPSPMQKIRQKVFTIGHSNHTLEELVELLREHGVDALADVRSAPYSRFNPQFNREPFAAALKACLLYTSPSPRDGLLSRMPSSA